MLPRSQNQFYFLLRQIALLVRSGETLETAIDKIRKTTTLSDYDTQALNHITSTTPLSKKLPLGLGPVERIKELLAIVKANNADTHQFFDLFYKTFLQAPISNLFRIYDISGLMIYLSAVLAVMTIIVTIYMIFVLPEFQNMFFDFGAELPKLTQLLLHISDTLGAFVIFIVIAVLFFLWYINQHTSHNLRTLSFCNSFIYKIPGISTIARNYNEYLAVNFLNILIKSGLKIDNAITTINNLAVSPLIENGTSSRSSSLVARQLSASYRLGTFEAELEYQIEQIQQSNSIDFNRIKDTITLFTLISVAVIVGTVVTAMYLPIFQMGRVII